MSITLYDAVMSLQLPRLITSPHTELGVRLLTLDRTDADDFDVTFNFCEQEWEHSLRCHVYVESGGVKQRADMSESGMDYAMKVACDVLQGQLLRWRAPTRVKSYEVKWKFNAQQFWSLTSYSTLALEHGMNDSDAPLHISRAGVSRSVTSQELDPQSELPIGEVVRR